MQPFVLDEGQYLRILQLAGHPGQLAAGCYCLLSHQHKQQVIGTCRSPEERRGGGWWRGGAGGGSRVGRGLWHVAEWGDLG